MISKGDSLDLKLTGTFSVPFSGWSLRFQYIHGKRNRSPRKTGYDRLKVPRYQLLWRGWPSYHMLLMYPLHSPKIHFSSEVENEVLFTSAIQRNQLNHITPSHRVKWLLFPLEIIMNRWMDSLVVFSPSKCSEFSFICQGTRSKFSVVTSQCVTYGKNKRGDVASLLDALDDIKNVQKFRENHAVWFSEV